jgi:hypothetical protein
LKLTISDGNPALLYAIFLYAWTAGQEVTCKELVERIGTDKSGYADLRFCSERAAADRLEYLWVETCCIDKATSDELSTAINFLFR